MTQEQQDPFQRLHELYPPEPNPPQASTSHLVFGLLEIVDELEKRAASEERVNEIMREVSELRDVVVFFQDFLKKGSRERLLKFFTETQLEQPDIFQQSLQDLQSAQAIGDAMIDQRVELSAQLLLLMVNAVQFAYIHLPLDPESDNTDVWSEFLSDIPMPEEKPRDPIQETINNVYLDLEHFRRYFFNKLFYEPRGRTHVGKELIEEVQPFLPGVRERLQFFGSLSVEQLTAYPTDQERKSQVVRLMRRYIQSIMEYVERVSTPENTDRLAAEKPMGSTLQSLVNSFGGYLEGGLLGAVGKLDYSDEDDPSKKYQRGKYS